MGLGHFGKGNILLLGMPVEKGLDMAAKASAIAVSRAGATASIPTRDEVEAMRG